MKTITKSRIMVVDDQPDLVEVLEDILANYGYVVSVAHSGDEAFEAICINAPDILLTDIVMPGSRNGIRLAQEFRSSNPERLIILMSGYVPNPNELDTLPGVPLLRKPFVTADLLTLLS